MAPGDVNTKGMLPEGIPGLAHVKAEHPCIYRFGGIALPGAEPVGGAPSRLRRPAREASC